VGPFAISTARREALVTQKSIALVAGGSSLRFDLGVSIVAGKFVRGILMTAGDCAICKQLGDELEIRRRLRFSKSGLEI
jgi:hypothetical protein